MCNFLYKYALVEPIVAQIFTQRYWQLSGTGAVSLSSPDDAPVVLVHTDATHHVWMLLQDPLAINLLLLIIFSMQC